MSDQAVLLPKWLSHGGIFLAKWQLDHSYTFWTISIMMFSPVYFFWVHTLLKSVLGMHEQQIPKCSRSFYEIRTSVKFGFFFFVKTCGEQIIVSLLNDCVVLDMYLTKGQLISKWLFVPSISSKKNENKSTLGFIVGKKNSFIRFFEETLAWKNPFDFFWPLVSNSLLTS